MANTITSSTLSGTYKDDYDESKGYHRLLFNSGRALQARELTQLQTIIQSEIARFGKNIYKDGAAVNPGGPTVDNAYEFIKLNTSVNTLPEDLNDLIKVEFTGQTSGIKFRVLEVLEAEGSDPATLYGFYTDTSSVTSPSSTASIRMTAGEDIVGNSVTLSVQTTNTTSNPAVGTGTKISNGAGDFFAQGHFVYAPQQSIIVSKYSNSYTGVVGFKVIQDVVTAQDDSTLYDNSGATLDTSSPGADRLRIRLELIAQDDVATDEDFVFYVYLVNSEVYEEAQPENDYNIPQKMLATRTFEESGNYVAKPFKATFEDNASDDTQLFANISPGTAYVEGYRAHVPSNIRAVINKARTTATVENQITSASYGNYVKVSLGKDLPTIGSVVNLRSATNHGGSTIGTAAVRYIHNDGVNVRLYLFNIQMNSGQEFRNVLSIGTSTSNYCNTVQELSKTVLYEANSRNVLFTLPYSRPKSLADISLEVGRRFTDTVDGNGDLTINLTATGETFVNTGDWIVVDNASGGAEAASITGSGTQSATINTSLASGTSITVWAKVDKSIGAVRSKTLTTTTVTAAVDSDGTLDLGKSDIYKVTAIRQTDASGADLSARFYTDNGRRPTHYDYGKLVVPAGQTAPSGNVYVEFSYFEHGTSGDFFAVNSYIGQVDYEDIPADVIEDGTAVNLRNVLDFRPTWNGSSFTQVNELPENSTSIRADVTYYEARADLIVIDKDANISVVRGQPAFNPKFPNVPVNALELFRIIVKPYTLNTTDLTLRAIEHKRYTMKDIADIDKRVNQLKELTTLSLLELDTSNTKVLDASGLDRTKSGFLVENFSDHSSSAISSPDYAAAVDPQVKIMRPAGFKRNTRLVYNSGKSSNVVLKGDNLYLPYDHTSFIKVDQASGTENVNPFAVFKSTGTIKLSPETDDWKDTEYAAAKAVSGGVKLSQSQSLLWNEETWGWAGTALADGEVGQEISMASTSSLVTTGAEWQSTSVDFSTTTDRDVNPAGGQGWSGTTTTVTETTSADVTTVGGVVQNTIDQTTTTVARVISSEVVTEVIDDRVVDVAIIPFMRSRKVRFKAEGLRPNSRYFPFFDGVDVSNWVTEEAFVFVSEDEDDVQPQSPNATQHPDGPSNLVADATGTIEGSFVIPCNDTLRFRTGTRQLRLIDISANEPENCLSLAEADFTSAGTLETRQETIKSTRIATVDIARDTAVTNIAAENIQTWSETESSVVDVTSTRTTQVLRTWNWGDPLAQSVVVTEPSGIYATKVNVYFQSKDDSLPIRMEIRPMVNGTPTRQPMPGAVKYLAPADVNVVPENTIASMLANPTTFEFDEPIYLAPRQEYAIVLISESNDYNVYISEVEQFLLGSTERRITRQPSLGSLFKSQNSYTWTPSQKEDLAFEMFRAEFDTSTAGEIVLENPDLPLVYLIENPFEFTNGSSVVRVRHPQHGFNSSDQVTLSGVATGTYGGSLDQDDLNGVHTIVAVDMTGYTIDVGIPASETSRGGGSDIQATRQANFDVCMPSIQSMEPNGTLIQYTAAFTTGKSLAGTETRYQKGGFYPFTNKQNLVFTAPRMIANSANEASELGAGERSATIKLNLTTSNDMISPVVDLQRTSLTLVSNIIDKQAASATAGYNVPLNYVAETEPTGGSATAKHITRPVTLAEDAVGLSIILSANRPSEADFVVYYRTGVEGDILNEQSWVEIAAEELIPSDDNPNVFREYRYLPGGESGSLDPFTQFQVKIVMRSTNSAKVPVFRDLRVIALAD